MIGPHGLPSDWFLRPAIDLELKQYTWMAYLQRVQRRFRERKLYPYLEDLRVHLASMEGLRQQKEAFERGLQTELLGFDAQTLAPVRDRPEEDGVLAVVDAVIRFAVPGLKQAMKEGEELREAIACSVRFEPLGVQPLSANEGWLLLRTGNEAMVYDYAMPLFREAQEPVQYRSVVTHYHATYRVGIAFTYEHIKADLVAKRPERPAPATFVLEADASLPRIETLVPLARRFVYAHITRMA